MRRSTPRPAFDEQPTLIRHHEASHHVWGDPGAGLVSDRVFLSTRALHVLEYQLTPGASFRHSPLNPTIFAADVVYAVLEGQFVIADPERGEVLPVRAGEAVHIHRDTWHHGFNPDHAESVRVLEFLAPPPARGTTSDYARRQPYLQSSTYRDERWRERWPEALEEQRATRTFRHLTAGNRLWSLAAASADHLLGTLVHTPCLQVVHGTVRPGGDDDFAEVVHESAVYCLGGLLWVDVHLPASDEYRVFTLGRGDVAYLPAGCRSRLLVRDSGSAEYYRASGVLMEEGWEP